MSKKFTASLVALSLMVASCTTQNPYTGETQTSKATIGAGIGAAVGAVGGLLIGGKDKRKSALIGAGVGALAGGGIGYYMDSQEAKLRQQLQNTGVSVTRNGSNIILNMPSNITFDVDQYNIKPGFYSVLDSVALVLKEYNQTLVDVIGHTDSTGSQAHNLELSENRASSVANYLYGRGIDGRRFQVLGAGSSQPIASNNTKQGRALNRRVTITLSPLS